MAPKPGSGIDIDSIKTNALKDVLDAIDSVRGTKALVLDATLTGPLGLVIKFPLLRDHGIDKVYHLEPGPLAVTHDKIIYFCRPQQQNAEMILSIALFIFTSDAFLDQIQQKSTDGTLGPREYHVYFIPRQSAPCVKILEDGGVLGDIVLGDLPLLFIPLEPDLLSLELENSFQELYFVRAWLLKTANLCRTAISPA